MIISCLQMTNQCSDQSSQTAKLDARAMALLQTEATFVHNSEFEMLSYSNVNHIPAGSSVYLETSGDCRNSGGAIHRLQSLPLLSAEGERHLFRKLNFTKYRVNVLRAGFDSEYPDMTVLDEIKELLFEADETRNHIVECNLRLVNSIVRRFVSNGNDLEELASEAHAILIKVVEKFDYSRGFRFSTYATHSIQRHIYRCLKHKRKLKDREYTTEIDMVSNVAEDKRNPLRPLHEIGPIILGPIEEFLNERESFVIKARFGIGEAVKPRTLRDIATEMNLSKERVRQIQVSAITKLREYFKDIEFEDAVEGN